MNQNGHTAEVKGEQPFTAIVKLQRDQKQVLLHLPPAPTVEGINDWNELWQHLKHRLSASEQFWEAQTLVTLKAYDRLLDISQLSAIAQALAQVKLHLSTVETTRRQTAVAAATAGYSVIQPASVSPINQPIGETQFKHSEPLYLKTTVRSGMEIRHEGTVMLLGDVNPGGAIIAQGDIIIWGRLRGIAHAGFKSEAYGSVCDRRACRIMGLHLNPTQLRIADVVARAPNTPPTDSQAEIAYISAQGIRITRGLDFLKTHRFNQEQQIWEDFPI